MLNDKYLNQFVAVWMIIKLIESQILEMPEIEMLNPKVFYVTEVVSFCTQVHMVTWSHG